jgi:hypothetical protein
MGDKAQFPASTHTQGNTSDLFFLQDVIEQKGALFIAAFNNWDRPNRQGQGAKEAVQRL